MMMIYLATEDGTEHEITTDQASFGFILKLLIEQSKKCFWSYTCRRCPQ